MSDGGMRFRDAKYCPFCSCESLSRDRYGETLERPRYKNEFTCESCGYGIHISPSMRWQMASNLAKQHREMRPPEREAKPKPPDLELYTLDSYAKQLGLSARRSKGHPTRFVLEGVPSGSTDFGGMMTLLRGI